MRKGGEERSRRRRGEVSGEEWGRRGEESGKDYMRGGEEGRVRGREGKL